MTSYIKAFNKSIENLIKQTPQDETLCTISKYKAKWASKDYYNTLDAIGFKVGIEYLVANVNDDNTDDTIGYMPILKFHKNNPLTQKYDEVEFSTYPSIDKAYAYIAKEHIYRLRRVTNLERFLD